VQEKKIKAWFMRRKNDGNDFEERDLNALK
jgi:hypothetical protein